MSDEPPLIEHNPHEKRQSNAIWWVWAILLPLIWAGYLLYIDIDWPSVALGGVSIGVLASWAIEVTGNKVPDSWRR